jgi:hypothetical protein
MMGLLVSVKKHPVLTAAVVLFASAALWITWFISSFDLNQYRQQLQQELGTRLSVPVQLGEASLRLRDAGIAVSFADVRIGDDASLVSIDTRELWMLFEWSGLLQRKLRFSKIGLAQPAVRLDWKQTSSSDGSEQTSNPPFLIDTALVQGIKIRTLEIRDGQFQFNLTGQDNLTRSLLVSGVNAQINDLELGQTAQVHLSALLHQEQGPASLQVDGNIDLPKDIVSWAASETDFNLDIAKLEGTAVIDFFPGATQGLTTRGQADLSLRVLGSVNSGLTLDARLDSQEFEITFPGSTPPVSLDYVQISGVLRKEEDIYTLKSLAVNLNTARLAGEASLRRDSAPRILEISLSQGSLPLDLLEQLLPKGQIAIPQPEGQGVLWIDRGELRISLDTQHKPQSRFEITQLEASLSNLAWQISPTVKAELSSLRINGSGKHWRLLEGAGQLGLVPLTFHGTIELQTDASPIINLQLDGSADFADLLTMMPPPGTNQLKVSGSFPFRTTLTGPIERLNLDAEANLDEIDVKYSDILGLPPLEGSRFNLHGVLTGDHLSIEHARLQRQPFTGRLSGQFDWSETPVMAITGLLEVSDLSTIYSIVPVVEKFDLNGAANLEFDLKGPFDKITRQAIFTLRDLGFSTRGITADISKVQGKIHVTKNGLKSEQLLARIGESPVTLKAELRDFSDPAVSLDIQARKIRADELIFYSDLIYLHDLDGRLTITGDGVEFSPVHVRLPNGTQATVHGSVIGRPHLDVNLDITSEFANIEEVIGLWSKLSPKARKQLKTRREARNGQATPHRVVIQTRAENGDLYGMKFQQATGTISLRPGLLQIHPLDFMVDGGDCTAQVLVDFAKTDPPLLRVSGHAEDVDAYRVYNELLGQKSILRGGLRGDFYLQGQLGSGYLPSSYGSFDIVVKDGVLRRFHILSKIFSLLNVAQLFTLQLPDMDLEGMPFNEINGSLIIDRGILSSEKLLVKSAAMNQSYVGQIDLVEKQVDFTLAIQPLGTVDKILSRIPVAGWLLTGKEKALITTHFAVKGSLGKPAIEALPATSISEKTLGLIRRTLGLPVKLVTDPSILWGGSSEEE